MTDFVLDSIVTSLINADGTLTIVPSPGVVGVTASLNLNNSNTWTAVQIFGNYISIGGKVFDIGKNTALATGDIIYNDGTNWVNLAIGSGTQLLGISGGIPAWVAAPVTTTIDGLSGAVTTGSPNSTLSIGTSVQERTFDINLSHTNSWLATQTFANYISIGGMLLDIGKTTGLATGDILYYDGTNLINLAIGSSTNVLTVSGGVPIWAASSGGAVASPSETLLSTTNPTNIVNYTTLAAGNYLVMTYFRVVTGPTVVTITFSWTDATGAQSYTYLNAVSEAVGSYIISPVFVNTTISTAIQVTYTAGTANQVYASASVVKE
jgi:hypothetical protein